jgi:hypothetical protein
MRLFTRVLMKREGARHYPPHASSAATVSVHVRDLAQLFNSLDPSPFWDRDLDPEAAQFIEEEFSEKLSAETWHLHVHAQEGIALAADLQAAVEHYYERLANSARRSLRDEMRLGQLALLGGAAIFLLSMTARGIVKSLLPGGAPRLLDEGLIILAWLALWRPAEWLVYGWIAPYRKRRLYERLAAIRVSVRLEAARVEAANAGGSTAPAPARKELPKDDLARHPFATVRVLEEAVIGPLLRGRGKARTAARR